MKTTKCEGSGANDSWCLSRQRKQPQTSYL